MSTRGSYLIDGMKLYVHHDNYPSGTACKFYETIKRYHRIDLFSFVRTVDEAERAVDLNKSGQEYCYKVDREHELIMAYAIDFKTDEMKCISSDRFDRWINREIKPALEETDKKEDYTIIRRSCGWYYTESQIIEEVKHQFNEGVRFADCGAVGNSSSCFHQCFELANLLPNNIELNELREQYKAKYALFFAEKYGHSDPAYFLSYADIKTINN
jgi:hypothetical protein